MLRRSSLALAALALTLVGCNSHTPAPGYDGPLPSPLARSVLSELRGEKVLDIQGTFGGGEWEIGPFAVIPNDVSDGGKGPVIRLEQGSRSIFVPIEADGDVADLYKRARGASSDQVSGDASKAYAGAWKRK